MKVSELEGRLCIGDIIICKVDTKTIYNPLFEREMMRKLASIRRIADLQPIPDADKIEVATVDGWKVVTQKGLYNVGDLVVFFEIDSWIPNELAPFLSKDKEPREYNGVKGERLRTVKLRGQISQGLLMPKTVLDGVGRIS